MTTQTKRPSNLKKAILSHPMVSTLHRERDGFNMRTMPNGAEVDAGAWWCYLKAGFVCPHMECGTIHEGTLAEVWDLLQTCEGEAEIRYERWIEPEDVRIEGNAMASGDDEADKACEAWIHSELDKGNDAAWCTAVVKAIVEIDGEEFSGSACLGCCSYESEKDLWAHNARDLESEARADLRRFIDREISRGSKAALALPTIAGA